MSTDRLFIALPLPNKLARELSRIQQALQSPQFAVRWSPVNKMHLTLAFLGDTERSAQAPLRAQLQQSLATVQQFPLQLAPLGCFPNSRRPSVVWAGVNDLEQGLIPLHQIIVQTLRALELPFDAKPFRAHLTLGRTKRDASPAQQAHIGQTIQQSPSPEPITWVADQVRLYSSDLQPSGALYKVIDQWDLLKSG
jgi:2'-5' RNA ligase